MQFFRNRFIDGLAILHHLSQAGSCNQSAQALWLPCSHGFVIGVKEKVIGLGVLDIAGKGIEEKLLEEPGGMGKVPLAGAGKLSTLNRHISLTKLRSQI